MSQPLRRVAEKETEVQRNFGWTHQEFYTKKRKNLHISARKQPNLVTPSKFFRSVSCSACNRRDWPVLSRWVGHFPTTMESEKTRHVSNHMPAVDFKSISNPTFFGSLFFMARLTQSSQKITHLLRLKPGKHRSFEEILPRPQCFPTTQRLWNLKAPAMSPITCPLLVSSRSLHGPTDSNLPNKSHTFSG